MKKRKMILAVLGLSFSLIVNSASFAFAEAPAETAAAEAPAEAGPVVREDGSVEAGLKEIQKYGNLVLDLPADVFLAGGYAYGDMISVTVAGQTLSMPVGSNYSDVDNGSYICRAVNNAEENRVILAINMGDLATTLGIAAKTSIETDPGYRWDFNPGFDGSLRVAISMQEKGGYADQYMIHQLARTNERGDYPNLNDEQFANFREVTTTGMGEGVLFRSSSPVNPGIGRNLQADAAAAAHGIRTVVNLADSAEVMQGFEGYQASYYAGCDVIPLNLGVDFSAPDFRAGLAEGLRFIAGHEGPYLVHCSEGKDRAGFTSAVLESLMGASADEVIADYMVTYQNYYGVGPEDPRYPVIANSNICKSIPAAFGIADLYSADLAAAAENYILGLGLSPEEVASLKKNLGGAAEEETTEAVTEETTEALPEEITTEAAQEEETTEAVPEEITTEAVTEEETTEAATEAVTEEETTEAAVTEEQSEAETEAPEEESTEEAETETEEVPAEETETEEPVPEEETTQEAGTAEPETAVTSPQEETTAEATTVEATTAEATTAEATTAEATTAEATTAEKTTAEATTAEATTAEAETKAQEPEKAKLPAVGETVSGFRVSEIREFPMVGAQALLFEHVKTGAGLMYIANEDTNRVFDLTFFTRAVDNTGLPHVFEHATLDGSEKYPSKSLFFNLGYQTYNTYMNASTYQDMTTYPVASLSEEQLLKYADYYTDSCFHPMIMKDESIFREEAWRYRLPDAESDLTIEGTVYSEMLGALTLARAAGYNNMRTALPGSYAGNVSGGDPAFIPDMTYEALKSYHDLYYHPSNCMAYLYGSFDHYEAFLQLLDAEFSRYEKREFSFEEPDYTPITEPVTAEYPFALEASSGTERASEIYYSIVIPGLKEKKEDELLINTLTDILVADSSPLMIALKKALPSAVFSCYVQTEGPEELLLFKEEQAEPEDAEIFRDTINTVLADIAENGIPQDVVDGISSSVGLSILLSTESDSVGTDLIASMAYNYSVSDRPYYYLDYVDALTKIDSFNSEGRYAEALKKYVIGNKLTALSVTYPVPGLKEEQDAALAERLAAYKAGLSEEELQALIDQTNASEEADDSSEYVAKLQAVTIASLPEEVRSYQVSDQTGADGVRRVNAEAGVDGLGQAILFLDAAGLPQEDIHWFHLYTDLMTEMDTASHKAEELPVLAQRYFYDGEIRLSLLETKDGGYHPMLRAGWIGMDEDMGKAYDLVYELLYETDFSDYDLLLSEIQKMKSATKKSLTNEIYSVQLYRAMAVNDPLYRYYNYYNYLEYYAFLEEAEQLCMESPEMAARKLDEVAAFFHNRAGAITAFAGNKESIANNQPLADAFMAKLEEQPVEAVSYELPVPAAREGIIIDSAVSYNAVVADFNTLGMTEFNAGFDAVTAFVSDTWLYPLLRDQYGAYGALHGMLEDGGMYVISYRDPNVRETFEVYDSLPEQIAEAKPDQETMDGYILSSYSYYAKSSGELSGAVDAILDRMTDADPNETAKYMRQLKGVTPEYFAGCAELYEKLMEGGVRSTAGGASVINANADLYDVILNPFGAKDASQTELTDVPEDSEYYEAVRAVFEDGLMAPVSEDTFGVDEPAVLGDLAAALYVLAGGEQNAPEDAVAFLASYGIAPQDAAADQELTAALCSETVNNFTMALGLTPEEGAEPEDKVLTRGETAVVINDYVNYLNSLEE